MKTGKETLQRFNSQPFFPKALKIFANGRSSGLLRFPMPSRLAGRPVACGSKTLKKSLQQRELLLILTGFPIKAFRFLGRLATFSRRK